MAGDEDRLRAALARIAEIAQAAAHDDAWQDDDEETDATDDAPEADRFIACVPKALPGRLLIRAAEIARRINPVNAPLRAAPIAGLARGLRPSDPLRIAVETAKYWGPAPRTLPVSFMEPTSSELRRRILSHLNAWTKTTGISFVATSGTGTVRISRGGGGYYSYLGTDVLLIPKNRQTMNLEAFTTKTSEAEYRRVVRHEAGHTLGFPHEHMRKGLIARIDRVKAYKWFLQEYGWDKTTVDEQVLTSLDERSLIRTPPDQTSIMCYQMPGSITKDGKPIVGGLDINATDYTFAGGIYPKGAAAADHALADGLDDEWSEEDDVHSVEA